MEKLLPQNIEAECGVLGSIIIDPEAIVQVSDFLQAEDFYRDAHRTIYEVILHLYQGGEPADFITICDELERRKQLEHVGGAGYITSLISQVPTSGNVEYYGHIVERTSALRRLIHAAGQIAAVAYEESDAGIALDKAEKLIFEISQRHSRSDFSSMEEILANYLQKLEQLNARRGTIVGVPTGFTDLDRMTGGLQRSDLIILAARPGVGKCLTARTLIDDPASGERLTIEECVQRRLPCVYGLSEQGHVRPTAVSAWIDSGIQPCYRVRTWTGREVEVTGHHPFLAEQGWTPLHDLHVGARIAIPRAVPVFGCDTSCSLEHVRLLAGNVMGKQVADQAFPRCVWRWDRGRLTEFLRVLMRHNGHMRDTQEDCQSIEFTTASRQLALDVQHAFTRLGLISTLGQATHGTWQVQITSASDLATYRRELGWLDAEEAREASLVRADPCAVTDMALYWDTLAAIEPIGEHQVYDLTVPDGNNFIAQDVFVHNTSFALSLAHNAAIKYKNAVAIFSLEMSKEQLAQRLVSMDAGIDQSRLRTGWIEQDEWEHIAEAGDKLAEASIWIDDTAGISTMEMRSKARRLQTEHGIDLVIVDYLQLMQANTGKRSDNRVQEVGEISRSLKGLARELNVPVLALSQLSRSVEGRQSKVPQLSDLRESGSLEQDSDIVMFIYRDDVYNSESERKNIADVIVAKHRNGPVGEVSLFFQANQTRFRDLEATPPEE